MEVQLPAHDLNSSQRGWVAHCNDVLTGGCWNEMETGLHINAQEMLAAFYRIKSFAKNTSNFRILLLSDIMLVAYVNHQGGTKLRILNLFVRELWQ